MTSRRRKQLQATDIAVPKKEAKRARVYNQIVVNAIGIDLKFAARSCLRQGEGANMRRASRLLLLVALTVPWLLTSNIALGQPSGGIEVTNLTTEYAINPLGIDVIEPRLSWHLESGERGQVQTAYHIQVASSESKLLADRPDVWDTGKVASSQSINVVYGGEPLVSRKRYVWRVKVWDKHGNESGWSEPAWWEMG